MPEESGSSGSGSCCGLGRLLRRLASFKDPTPDLNYWSLTFKDPGLESGFAKARAAKLASSMVKCSVATGTATGIILISQRPWKLGREHYASSEVMHIMQTSNMFFGLIVVCTLLVPLVFSVPCISRRASPALLEAFSAGIVCTAMVLFLFSIPNYTSKMLGYDPKEHLDSMYITDTGLLLTIDALITGSHMLLPIRFCFILIVQVAGLLTYLVPASTVGSAESQNVFRFLIILVVLIGLASIGKRGLERDERTQFLTLIREKSLRFQSEFQLAKFQQQGGPRVVSEPSEAGKESLPSTTESGRIFNANGKAHLSKEFIEEIALIGGREQWLVKPSEIMIIPGQLLGEGAFGRVVVARYQGIRVALKVPKIRTKRITDISHLVELCDELRVLRRVRHPNIVLFYGASLDEQNFDMALVLELVDGVSLRSFVRAGKRDDSSDSSGRPYVRLPSEMERSQVLVDVACALQYLHSRTPHIAHGDLKDSNVFVESVRARTPVRGKLLDFGLSRMLTRHAKPMGGTMSWLAPELLRTRGKATSTAADVFSFGRLAFFVITGRWPFHAMTGEEIEQALAQQKLPPLSWPPSSWLSERWQPVVERCSGVEASSRPTMGYINSLASSWHSELLESKVPELPLDITQLIAGGQGQGTLSAQSSRAQRHPGSSEPAHPPTHPPTSSRQKVVMSEFADTPKETVVLLLMEAIVNMNMKIPVESCCDFHGTVHATLEAISMLRDKPCKDWALFQEDAGRVIGQCSQCGVLIRKCSQSGSGSSLPTIFECFFCEHRHSWAADSRTLSMGSLAI